MSKRLRLAGLSLLAAASAMLGILPATGAQAATVKPMVDQDGYQEIVQHASRACVDVRTEEGINNNGAHLQNYHCTGSGEQKWRLVNRGNGYYWVVNKRSGKCMDVRGAWTVTGADVWQWDCANVPQQEWKLIWNEGYPPGAYQLQAHHSGQCLELAGGDGRDHTMLWQNNCDPWYAQLWEFR
jgi:mannan endo-1,4-beta-mannosidase